MKARASVLETELVFPSEKNELDPLLALLLPGREEPCSLVAPRVSLATVPRLSKKILTYTKIIEFGMCFRIL